MKMNNEKVCTSTKGDPIKNLSGKYLWDESAKEAKNKAEKLALDEVKKRY